MVRNIYFLIIFSILIIIGVTLYFKLYYNPFIQQEKVSTSPSINFIKLSEFKLPLLYINSNKQDSNFHVGKSYSIDNFFNNKILITFIASWCPVCKSNNIILRQIKAENDIKIIGILWQDNFQKLSKETRETYDYILHDVEGMLAIQFGISGIPESFILSKDNKILLYVVGMLSANSVSSVLNKEKQ